MRSRAEMEAAGGRTGDRRAFESLLVQAYGEADEWYLPGFCQACDNAVAFLADGQYAPPGTVNFRERLLCPSCELNNRQRFMAHLVRTALAERGDTEVRTYLHEQVTPFFAWASRALPGEVVGSEYVGHDVPGGTVVNGVRHEDALALSFEDESFDVIVSNEVFEHVPEIEPGFAEAARVLRPSGTMFMSIPFHAGADTTVKRASLVDGEVVEHLPAEYHGNPMSEKGSLVFYDHGWEVLDNLRCAGFADAYLLGYWSALYGYLGDGMQTVFVATRSAS